jgi:hypothetical protein
MIRSYGLKRVYAGSFYSLSQGVFAEAGIEAIFEKDFAITAPSGQPLNFPKEFSSVKDGIIFSFVERPVVGQLRHNGTDWLYAPPDGFAGEVKLRFSVSNTFNTDEGLLTLKIGE